MARNGETWKFIAHCPQAEQVYLVKDRVGEASAWLAMSPAASGRWELVDDLDPGYYRFRYYTVEGQTYLNGGSAELTAVRLAGDDPAVRIEPLDGARFAASA